MPPPSELHATAVGNREACRDLCAIAVEQAALRRVATLVAEATPPAEVFAAVAGEIGRLLPADIAVIVRYHGDGTITGVASWTRSGQPLGLTDHLPLDGRGVTGSILKDGRPARCDSYEGVDGALAQRARALGLRSTVGVPIRFDGHLWGAILVSSTTDDPFPPHTEARLTDFTELVVTAMSNAQARAELRGLADEQAALRRVAVLVAQGVAPAEVLSEVTQEVRAVFGAHGATIVRLDPDGKATTVARAGPDPHILPVGSRGRLRPPFVLGCVLTTGRPARVDDYGDASGPVAEAVARLGIRSAVASPIVVGGRLWGSIAVASKGERFPADTEQRLTNFTEVVATAIANGEAQTELMASRARIVASADQARRRIERDLHDGAQQRLVSLGVHIREAQAAVPPELDGLAAQLRRVASELAWAVDELRDLASGIHPAILARGGLTPALRTLARRSLVPVALTVRVDGRLPEPVEVAAYYVVSETLTNAAKHAGASKVTVDVVADDGGLRISVSDDGVGGADLTRGSGLIGLKDRVEALGGRIALQSERGSGTLLSVGLPRTQDGCFGSGRGCQT
jgi:signal transduction histidine kinase